jgi:uncharacterized protein YbdZ (MbtH family)
MANPFEDDEALYLVLVNDEGQHSIWPTFADIPPGWAVAFCPHPRRICLEYVEKAWTDMRPASLVQAMSDAAR